MGENRKKYESDIRSKRNYNSKMSSFQINRDLHSKIKELCRLNNISVRLFIEKSLMEKLNNFDF